jgi:fatty-acyl-CoA synthase
MRLHDFFDFNARERGDLLFASCGSTSVSYGEAFDEVNRLADCLRTLGLVKGDRFAYLSKSSLEMLYAILAGAKTGIVPVPLNTRLAPAEWRMIVEDCRARVLIAQGAFAAQISPVTASSPDLEIRLAIDAGVPSGWDDYRKTLAHCQPREPVVEVAAEDDLLQMYTSGTTGRAKGVVISHRALVTNMFQMLHSVEASWQRGDRSLLITPLFHSSGATALAGTIMMSGSILIQPEFDPAAVVYALSEERIASLGVVPAMVDACLNSVSDVADRSYEHLNTIFYGGSPIAEDTLRRAMEVFGCSFHQTYGQTECTGGLTALNAAAHRRALADDPSLLSSCGRPLMGTEIRIVGESGDELPVGEVGELVARGPQVMTGYWGQPEATDEVLRDGWLHTGDAARVDDEGFLYIVDRIKDMVVSGGENIYPREVEEVLMGHPAVRDVAIIGVPDDRYGEAPMAFVVCDPEQVPPDEELIAFCRDRLGGYKVPRRYRHVDALPRNAAGKVLKKDLREPFWRGRARGVS